MDIKQSNETFSSRLSSNDPYKGLLSSALDAVAEVGRRRVLRALKTAGGFCGVLILASTAQAQRGYQFSPAVAVGVASAAQPVSVTIQSAGTLGTVQVLTEGSPNLDYSGSGGTCTTGVSYTSGQSCTIQVTFTAKYPGIRTGAVVLTDGNGSPMGSELVYGVGTGPLSVLTAGEIVTVAGNGHLSAGTQDGTLAVNAVIHEPLGVAVDGAGNFYYTDSGNNRIGMVNAAGTLTTIAGTGQAGYSPDGTLAVNAAISFPAAILVDGAGNVYFTEVGNDTVREIVKTTGKLYTVAGNGTQGYSGDGGAATSATLNGPQGLAMDASGNLYIADTANNVVRKVSALDGTISTFAGNGTQGYAGDGGQAATAELGTPYGLTATSDGSLYIADFYNNRIRKIASTGVITTVVGTGMVGYTGDKAAALQATLDHPASVAVDAAGDIFIGDSENNVVRKVNGATQFITTLAGSGGSASGGDGADADGTGVTINKPYGISLDSAGDLFIADRLGLKIREVYGTIAAIAYKDIKVTNTSAPISQGLDNDGNAPLHLSSITPVTNSAIDAASTTCSTSVAMAIGATCVIGAEFKPETVGSPVTGTISIASDSSNTPVTIDLSGNSLSIEPTTTTLTSSVNPSAVGQAVTFTATVSSQATSVTGTVEFLDGTTELGGTAQILNSTTRTATFTTTSLALGSHTITAVYSGDNASATSTSSALTQIVKQSSTLNLVSNLNPAKVYDAVTFTVTASETPAGGSTPTGSIVFSSDGSLLPNGTIGLDSNGIASYTTTLLAAGSHKITATYAGDTNNLGSASNVLTETINSATTTTTLTTSNASVLLTVPVTFTASVVGNNSSTPTGNVVFKDGTTSIGTIALNSTGTAALTISTLATGTHTITAVYGGDSDYAGSTSAAVTETINKIATSATIASSLNPSNSGATVNFTVTITAADSTSPNVAITGKVQVMEGSTVLGTGTLAAFGTGPATANVAIAVSSFAPGSHAVTAIYAGDTNYTTSTSSALLETVNQSTSSVALTASATTVIATKPVTFTAKVTSTGGTPTGAVDFMDGTLAIGIGNLTNGVATYTTSTLAVGTHSITAVYQGDADDSVATSSVLLVTVNTATTAVKLTPSQNPTNFGQLLTLTAAVTGNGGVPTGNVTFTDGTTALQSVAVNASGMATYTTSTLTVGAHTFTASYAGDANDASSVSSPLTIQVLQTITLTVSSTSPNPSTARSNVHFVATITAQQSIQPTGSITFMDGATAMGTGAISGTTATFDTTTLSVGTHAITAVYAGDSSTQSLTSPAYSQTINAAGASISLASSANPATFGTLVVFTATATSTAGTLTGTVNFQDGGTTIGSAALSSTGVATFSTSTLTAGSHNIVAAYQGDANDQPGNSSTLVQVVERSTSVTLSASQNPLLTLAPVTITATVANGGSAVPTGMVTFSQDSVAVSTVAVGAGGTATLQVTSLTAGSHSFTASYSGDSLNLASASPALNEVVQLRTTSDVLTSSATSLTGGQQVTLISVVRWNGMVTPTGSVTFLNGTTSLATVPVDPTGVATVTVLLSGTSATLSSSYSGDASYAPSISPPDLITIGAASQFTIDANPPNFSLVSKQYQILKVTIESMKGFTDTLSLGCNGLPEAATCTFSNDQMMLAPGGIQTVTLTVDTGNPLLAGTHAKNEAPKAFGEAKTKMALTCFIPGGLLLGLIGVKFRRLRGVGGLLLILLLAGLSTALTGCGAVNLIGTPAGTYNFNISAVGKTGVSQSIPVTMTVTQ